MHFEFQPVLEGDLVTVRPLRAGDFDDLWAVASDRLVWEQHPAKERATAAGFRSFFEASLASGGALVVTDRGTGAVIGSSRYHGHDEEAKEVEIGWTYLARMYWGGRYNRELKQLMLDHAFRFVESVVFLVGTTNFRSQRAVEKLGAVRDRSRRDASGRESFRYRIRRRAWAGEERQLP
jgi:RimJ/RimL family protein N-acetyltransferase